MLQGRQECTVVVGLLRVQGVGQGSCTAFYKRTNGLVPRVSSVGDAFLLKNLTSPSQWIVRVFPPMSNDMKR